MNIDDLSPTSIIYGDVHEGLGPVAERISNMPFVTYMSFFPEHPRGLWGVVRRISRNVGIDINIKADHQKSYHNTTWKYIK